MKKRTVFSSALTILGFLLAGLTLSVVLLAMRSEPKIIKHPDSARQRAESMMDAVCSGNFAAASAYIYGTPKLGSLPEDCSSAVEILWNTYRNHLSYAFSGDCYATPSGAAIDVTVTSLDLTDALHLLPEKAQHLLEERSATLKGQTELFDENNQLRPEQADKILSDAMLLSLNEGKAYRERTIALSLVYDAGQWWVVPEGALLDVLSGSLSS